MTKEMLKQYRFCKKRIAELDDKIDRLKRENTVRDSVQGSQKDFPYIMRTSTVCGCPDILDDASELRQLCEERTRCKRIVREASVFIHSVEDNIIRRALIMRYMEGKVPAKWDKIAVEVSGGNTADSIRMAVTRYIEKI